MRPRCLQWCAMSQHPDLEKIKGQIAESNDGEKMILISQLAQIPDGSGASAIMDLLRQYAGTEMMPKNVLWTLNTYAAHADIYFPDLFNYVFVPEYTLRIFRLCDTYLRAQWLSPAKLRSHFNIIMLAYLDRKKRWSSRAGLPKDQWGDDYADLFSELNALLGIFGFLAEPQVETELFEALDLFADAALKFSAVDSLWRLGHEVDDKYLLSLMADDFMRVSMYARLKVRDRLSLFPEQYRTAEAFAQSYLCNMLSATFATQPAEIELKNVIQIKLKNRTDVSIYYVFRILTDLGQWPEEAWVAGWVGPFPQQFDFFNLPLSDDTWTLGDNWDSSTPEKHVIDYLKHYRNYEIESPK